MQKMGWMLPRAKEAKCATSFSSPRGNMRSSLKSRCRRGGVVHPERVLIYLRRTRALGLMLRRAASDHDGRQLLGDPTTEITGSSVTFRLFLWSGSGPPLIKAPLGDLCLLDLRDGPLTADRQPPSIIIYPSWYANASGAPVKRATH